ncbi:SMP-30/gluconolactonase/LRE family protein [Mesorhizobium sp. J428]|uniref:SMP-30/gluconolactonase/LRE family protein n=1 Tax=Mesorhizobium sp. J428 TaxID=2898440 RepID=UPI002151E9A2|nr:SMP-30/gluconolactonase/LRE family protein [Mesorhizobium sp. J428]MCR5859915.1 SMP-30/gluconolactonase/LRE family protein [Mesorhizobium sp. J428]
MDHPLEGQIHRSEGEGRLVCGLANGIWMLDLASGAFEPVFRHAAACRDNGRAQALVGGIRISNLLCFSPDGRVMYVADSLERWIRCFGNVRVLRQSVVAVILPWARI